MAKTSDRVVLGFVHPTEVSAYFLMSLLGAALHDLSPAGNTRFAGVINRFSSANISNSRNEIVREFLTEYDAEWLLFVDADMHFQPEAIEGVMRHAHHEERPIVGGLCFGITDGRLFPTLYDLSQDEDTGKPVILRRTVVPDDELVQVTATGAAFLLISRGVLLQMFERGFNRSYPWFQETEIDGAPCSEDFTFCLRAGMLGHPVHVDTSVQIGHHKSMVLDLPMFRAQQRAAEEVTVDG